MKQPLFSVVVPTRNRVESAKRAIASLLLQKERDFELVVSDNSTARHEGLEEWLRSRTDLPDGFAYLRTGGGLRMDENWEMASRRANGRYLLILPDRWVMRPGALTLLTRLLVQQDAECVFWDCRLALDPSGQTYVTPVETAAPIACEVHTSAEVLFRLLQFRGYIDDSVFGQPFPRGLNSMLRNDVAASIRRKLGVLFGPVSCDYTSGASVLLNTSKVTHLVESLYLPVGTESNGQRNSVFGVPPECRPATHWRGLEIDAVLMTMVNDLESTLHANGAAEWIGRIDAGNVLISLLNEIHFKEWHGSPLDTARMRGELFAYAERHSDLLGGNILCRLNAYDSRCAPSWVPLRKQLQKAGVFYALYRAKHLLKARKFSPPRRSYADDHLSDRSVNVRELGTEQA